MIAAVRLYAAAALRDRGILPPLAALAFALLGVFAYRPNDVEATWALTALLGFPLAAWLTGAVLAVMPVPEREIVVAALGGARRHDRATALFAAVVAALVTVAFLVHPLVIDAFERPVTAGDLARSAAAHLAVALLGAQVGRAALAPVVARRADVAVLVVVLLLASVASGVGPMGVAAAHADGGTGALALACVGCLALTVVAEVIRRLLVRRSG